MFSQLTSALMITEIMYDPAGTDHDREWIEIYNDGLTITMADIKFVENGVGHKVSVYHGNTTLHTGGFAVISDDPVKFMADYPDFAGNLLDSSWSSLSNSGEELGLAINSTVVDFLSYDPIAKDTGFSIERNTGWESSDWLGGTPGYRIDLITNAPEVPEFSLIGIATMIIVLIVGRNWTRH